MEENRQPHSPLAGGCIRLLTLFPGSFCSPIEGQLTDVTLTAGCAYEALSYVWGDKGDPLMMNVNKKPFYITKNLECALRHLRYTEDLRILWVDAICINQQDDDEKSKQVAMMGRIYNEAQKVYAWLGEGNRQSDCVFDVLKEYQVQRARTFVSSNLDAAEQLSSYRQLFRDTFQDIAGYIPEEHSMDDGMLHEEFQWLRPLYERHYWRRVWIVQELVLAKTIVVCCGDRSINFDDIYGLSLGWGSFEQGFDCGIYHTEASGELESHLQGWNTIRTIRGHRRRREPSWAFEAEGPIVVSVGLPERGDVAMLDEVVQIYAQYHECTDSRDKAYGFRELVPQWKDDLVVDYSKSTSDVFVDVAKLDLFKARAHGGTHVAFRLWSAMGLGNQEDRKGFDEFVRQRLPQTCITEFD
jgi:hypothetical protein